MIYIKKQVKIFEKTPSPYKKKNLKINFKKRYAYVFFKFTKIKQDLKKVIMQNTYALYLTISQNNIFSTCKDISKNLSFFTKSCGSFKIAISKKRLKFSASLFFYQIRKFIKNILCNKISILFITSPRFLKKYISKYFISKLFETTCPFLLCFNPKKSFNGCRVKKLKRKKYKKNRILKS